MKWHPKSQITRKPFDLITPGQAHSCPQAVHPAEIFRKMKSLFCHAAMMMRLLPAIWHVQGEGGVLNKSSGGETSPKQEPFDDSILQVIYFTVCITSVFSTCAWCSLLPHISQQGHVVVQAADNIKCNRCCHSPAAATSSSICTVSRALAAAHSRSAAPIKRTQINKRFSRPFNGAPRM